MNYYKRRPVSFYSYGWWSLPGIVYRTVTAVMAGLGAVVGVLVRWGWRYRSELAPLATAAVIAYTGAWLHAHHSTWAPGIAALTVALVASLAALRRRWLWRWPWLWHTIERVYIGATLTLAGGWLTVATAVGPDRPPLPALGWIFTLLCAVPWWTHHRRRFKIRLERIGEAWPSTAEAAGVAGTAIVSMLGTSWGWAARVALPRGMTSRQVIDRIPQIESGLGVRPGAVRVEPDPRYADRVTLRVIEADPHAAPIAFPGAAPSTIERPIVLGLFEDGSPVIVLVVRRNMLIGGVVDSGKSGIVNVILAALVACPDVVVWGIDLKGGMELHPWAPCLGRLATTPEAAMDLLRDAVAELDHRAQQQSEQGGRLWEPTPQSPALVVIVDEYAELPREAAPLTDSLVRRGRAVAVNLIAATQRPTQKAMGQGAVRSQMDIRIALRVRERADGELILGSGSISNGWNPDTLDAPGKFLISAREHTIPRPARAFLITDQDVAETVRQYADARPTIETRAALTGTESASAQAPDPAPATGSDTRPATVRTPTADELLWRALSDSAHDGGITVAGLAEATGRNATWVYRRLRQLRDDGLAQSTSWGRWNSTTPPEDHAA